MSNQFRPFAWSIPLGEWAGTRVAFSVWFAAASVVFCLQLGTVSLGLLAAAVLLVSVLLHEVAHVWVARETGGWCNEIVVWPLGGLVAPQPTLTRRSQVLTALAGPAVHTIVCLVTGITVWRAGVLDASLDPFSSWPAMTLSGGGETLKAIVILVFTINWALLLVNLLPVHPFDAGRVLEWMLSEWLAEDTATNLFLRLGVLVGVVLFVAGLLGDQPAWHGTWMVGLGAVVLVFNLEELSSRRAEDELETALLEYELAIEDVVDEFESVDPDAGLLERWQQRRAENEVQEEQARQQEVEQQVDGLLKKVHNSGFDGLSEAEKQQLRQASQQYRERSPRPEETV
ncbi:hypothetical protein OAJ60_05715 [Planctomycetaceae bacterium]|nr:hypothetical protein [Planctomycetaceae bacterium]